jgi:hypothetical protein
MTDRHIDLDSIAAFHAGVLGRFASAHAARHLAGCAMCTQRAAAVTDVTALLARTPAPPMPEHVVLRLDAALAAEITAASAAAGSASSRAASSTASRALTATAAPRSASAPGSETPGPVAHGPGPQPSRGHRRGGPRAARSRLTILVIRPLAAAAALCLLAGGSYLLFRQQPGPAATSSAAAAPDRRVHQPTAGTALTPRQPQAGEAPGAQGATSGGQAAAVLIVHTSTDYQPARLRAQATTVLREFQGEIPAAGQAELGTAQPFGSAGLSACLNQVAPGQPRLLVDMATYRSSPATVIIAPARPGQSGHVWVVSPGCSAASHRIAAHADL